MQYRVVIQLVECYIWDVVVAGSNPVYPTNKCSLTFWINKFISRISETVENPRLFYTIENVVVR